MSELQRTFRTAREFAEAGCCRLSDDAQALVANDRLSMADFFRVLLEKQLFADAVRFIGVSLPKREAIWWGCLCIWHDARPTPSETEERALRTALAWVEDPTDTVRRLAGTAGQAAGADTPAGLLAQAVFLSGGSLSPPEQPAVEPGPSIAGQAVGHAVLMAARQAEADEIDNRMRQYLKIGVEVAEGKTRWEARVREGERATRPR